MALGTYNTIKEANIDLDNDIEIWYYYQPSRSEIDGSFNNGYKRVLNIHEWLEESRFEDPSIENYGIQNVLFGMYTLKLPLTIFNRKGFYNIYLKPREVFTTIDDSDAVLSAFPNIRGIVLRASNLNNNQMLLENGNAVGARISYFDNNGSRQQVYRIVTSNFRVEPVNDNLSDGNQKAVRYRYNDNSDLVFLTLSPSSAPSTKPNALPFVGSIGQTISLTRGNFNPISLEIEMVNYDEEGIATLLVGNQTRSLDDNIITTYNNNDEIFSQQQVYTLKQSTTGDQMYQVRENMDNNIDMTKQWDEIVGE